MAPSSTLIAKLKVQLKLSISRLRMVQAKDTAIAKQQRRAMAHLLEQGKEESARIRVENIIRRDVTTELHEMLELYCELLLARAGLLEGGGAAAAKECDPGLEEAVKSLIHAAPRTDIRELHQTRLLLVEKYGKDFALAAMENADGKVADRVLRKLRVEPPSPELVTLYLAEIAKTYGVEWPRRGVDEEEEEGSRHGGRAEKGDHGDDDDDDDDDQGTGGVQVRRSVELENPLPTDELSRATPPRDLGPRSPVTVVPPGPSTENLSPKIKLPAPPELKPGAKMTKAVEANTTKGERDDGGGDDGGGDEEGERAGRAGAGVGKKAAVGKGVVEGKIPDVDELAARFAALKK